MTEPNTVPPPIQPPDAHSECGYCRRPIEDQYFEFMGRACCPNCAREVLSHHEKQGFDPAVMLIAGFAGLGAALASGLVWAIIAKAANLELGILAVGIGWAVSATMRFVSRGRRGVPMQILGIALAIVGIVFGKVMTLVLFALAAKPAGEALPVVFRIIIEEPTVLFGVFDLVWILIACMGPYRTFKPLNLRIAGPFHRSAGGSQILQFDRVQPTPPPEQG